MRKIILDMVGIEEQLFSNPIKNLGIVLIAIAVICILIFIFKKIK